MKGFRQLFIFQVRVIEGLFFVVIIIILGGIIKGYRILEVRVQIKIQKIYLLFFSLVFLEDDLNFVVGK